MKPFLRWRTMFGMSLILLLIIPTMASAAQNHYYSGGWSLYSMTYKSVDAATDNGRCYQGAENWRTTAGTTMTQDNTAGKNLCYWRNFPLETWYGKYTPYSTYFKIEVNKQQIEADFSGYSWAAGVNVATHEFGHAQYLGDHDTAGEGVYTSTSIMSYSRDRTASATPGSHDLADLNSFRNPSFLAPVSENKPEPKADFPHYTVDKLIQENWTNLVVVATVESVQEIKDDDPEGLDLERSHQEAVLRIEDEIFGQANSKAIKLYQTVERVKEGSKYLLFLTYRPTIDQYVVSDGNSQIAISETTGLKREKELDVTIKGIEGQYSREELKQLLNQIASNKES